MFWIHVAVHIVVVVSYLLNSFLVCTSEDIYIYIFLKKNSVLSLSSFQECCAIAYLKTYKS